MKDRFYLREPPSLTPSLDFVQSNSHINLLTAGSIGIHTVVWHHSAAIAKKQPDPLDEIQSKRHLAVSSLYSTVHFPIGLHPPAENNVLNDNSSAQHPRMTQKKNPSCGRIGSTLLFYELLRRPHKFDLIAQQVAPAPSYMHYWLWRSKLLHSRLNIMLNPLQRRSNRQLIR